MPRRLGVNIDHVATLRQARQAPYPDPVAAAMVAELAGADQITCHIRMDRRHIQERDLELLARTVQTRLNVEMVSEPEMMSIAESIRPHQVTLVPERPEEVTTEGGLDLTAAAILEESRRATATLRNLGIEVAIFADPSPGQVEGVVACGAGAIEINTAAYAEASTDAARRVELARIEACATSAAQAGLYVAAGHGLHYHNIGPLVGLGRITEYNIGHAIIARAIFSGLDAAIRDMKALL